MSQLVVLCAENRWLVVVYFLCRWHYRSSEEREIAEKLIEQLLWAHFQLLMVTGCKGGRLILLHAS
jgi:hypothetical protein